MHICRVSFYFFVTICFLPTIVAQAKVIGNDVGDTTKGYWRGLSFQEGTCPIKGKSDEPFTDIISSRTTTQGRYRLLSWVLGPGETVFDNCEETSITVFASCIDGFQEASAMFSFDHFVEAFADNEYFYGCQMISGSAYACKFKNPTYGFFYERKFLLCEKPYSYYEWLFYDNQVNDPEFELNQGPPCPPGQCCDV